MKNRIQLLKKIACAVGIVLLTAGSAKADEVYQFDFSDPFTDTDRVAIEFGGGDPDVGVEQWFGPNNGVGIADGVLSFTDMNTNRYRGAGVWLDTTGWVPGLVTVAIDVANFVAGTGSDIFFQAYAANGVDATNGVSLDLHEGPGGAVAAATGTAMISTLGIEQTITGDGTAVPFTFIFNGTDEFVGLTFGQLNTTDATVFASAELDNLTVNTAMNTEMVVPEPTSLTIFAFGSLALIGRSRRRV